MSMSIDYLYRIIDKYSPILNKMAAAGKKFDKTVTKIQTSLGRMEDKFKSAGAKMANLRTGLASLGAGVFLKSTIDEAKQFQQALNLTKAVTGATSVQMDTMRTKALEWGASTQFSSLQVSQAMAELGKMGNDTNQIISLMPGTMALAAAGEISMAEAATFSMQAINQMGLQLSDAEMVADVFATGASNASTSVSGLASAFTNTGLQAKLSGLDIQDTTASLMALAGSGLEGQVGGTMLMNALKSLQVMSPKVRKGFEDMEIDIDNFRDSTTGQMIDFYGLIGAMKDAGATGAQMGKMFDVRAMKAMAVLVETDTEKLQGFRDVLKDTTGASQEMQDTLLEGLKPFVEFESVTQNLKVIMGGFVMEALTPALEKFNEWLGNMQKNNPETLKWITYLLMGVTALGAVLIPLGLTISALGSLFGAIKLALGITKIFGIAQALLSGAFGLSGTSIANTTIATNAYIFGSKIAMAATKVWAIAQAAFAVVMNLGLLPITAIILGIMGLIAIIILVVKHWDTVTATVKKVWNWFMKLLDNPLIATAAMIFAPFLAIPALIIKYWEPIKAFFLGIWETIKPIIDAVGGFFGGGKEMPLSGFGAGSAADIGNELFSQAPVQAPIPGGYGRANATANATVSVYTEKGLTAKPFEPSGDLGYNMSDTYSRGM